MGRPSIVRNTPAGAAAPPIVAPKPHVVRALWAAIVSGERDRVQHCIDKLKPHELGMVSGGTGQNALHVAVAHGQPVFCDLLLRAGADRALRDKDGHTPMDLN